MLDSKLFTISRTVLSLMAVALLAYFIVGTWQWPLVGDAPLVHYGVFLIQHGMLPYRDILDPNMPGTYLLEATVMRVMGPGAQAWRLFDFLLLATATVAMYGIARRRRWFAALFGATLLALVHGRDGLVELGQRDLVLSVLLLLAYVSLFRAIRCQKLVRQAFWSFLIFGLMVGLATTIKPLAVIFFPPLMLISYRDFKRSGIPFTRPFLVAVCGVLLPWIPIYLYLTRLHLTRDFLETITRLVPALTAIGHRSLVHLVLHSFSGALLPLVLLWLPVAYARRSALKFERAALLAGVVSGLLCFYAQGKGYPYHRYPSEAFLLLLIGTDLNAVLLRRHRNHDVPFLRETALAGLYVGILVVGGGSLVHALRQDWRNQDFNNLLAADLNQLGGARLSGHVQCLDMADGCIPELYNLHLVQSTGFLYDCYMLSDQVPLASRLYYQSRFRTAIKNKQPAVFVVTNFNCGASPGYSRLARWPEFNHYLSSDYELYSERSSTRDVRWGSSPSKPLGYRIYVRRSVALQ